MPILALVALAGVFAAGPLAAAPPVPLLPGIVDSPDTEVRPAFSPDGRCILWGSIGAPKTTWRILQTCRDGAGWSRPEAVSLPPCCSLNVSAEEVPVSESLPLVPV